MSYLNFQLVSPERVVLKAELVSLTCPTEMGYINILPHHVPLVANLAPGEIRATDKNKENFSIYVTGGFVEVGPENNVKILADAAEHSYEIDEERAKQAKERAEKAMKEEHLSAEEYAKVAASLERNLSRLKIARKRSHRNTPLSGQGTLQE